MVVALIVMFAAGVWLGFGLGLTRGMAVGASANSGNKPSFLPWCLVVAGGIALIAGVAVGLHRQQFLSKAIRTSGTVVENREHIDQKEGSTTYSAVFAFTDTKGKEHRVEAGLRSSPPTHQVGEQVPILYNPADPRDASIESFAHLWLLPTVMGCIAAVTIPSGTIWLIFRQLKRA